MTIRSSLKNRLTLWWKWYEGWMAALFLAVVSFLLGVVSAQQVVQAHHVYEIQQLVRAYSIALDSKNDLILKLATSSAEAANSAAKAADAAAQTADRAEEHRR